MTLAVFWGMALCVFLQFFTRYVLNNSLAWTEEIAINCLVVVVFLGSVWCVRQSRHIQVDVLYHYLPHGVGAACSRRSSTSSASSSSPTPRWLLWRYVGIVAQRADGHRSTCRARIVFYTVFAAFVLMLLRSIQVAVGQLAPRLFGARAPRSLRRPRGLTPCSC